MLEEEKTLLFGFPRLLCPVVESEAPLAERPCSTDTHVSFREEPKDRPSFLPQLSQTREGQRRELHQRHGSATSYCNHFLWALIQKEGSIARVFHRGQQNTVQTGGHICTSVTVFLCQHKPDFLFLETQLGSWLWPVSRTWKAEFPSPAFHSSDFRRTSDCPLLYLSTLNTSLTGVLKIWSLSPTT